MCGVGMCFFSLIAIGDDRRNASMFHLGFGGMFVLDSIPVCIFLVLIANNTECSSCYDEIGVIMGGVGLGGVG